MKNMQKSHFRLFAEDFRRNFNSSHVSSDVRGWPASARKTRSVAQINSMRRLILSWILYQRNHVLVAWFSRCWRKWEISALLGFYLQWPRLYKVWWMGSTVIHTTRHRCHMWWFFLNSEMYIVVKEPLTVWLLSFNLVKWWMTPYFPYIYIYCTLPSSLGYRIHCCLNGTCECTGWDWPELCWRGHLWWAIEQHYLFALLQLSVGDRRIVDLANALVLQWHFHFYERTAVTTRRSSWRLAKCWSHWTFLDENVQSLSRRRDRVMWVVTVHCCDAERRVFSHK